MTQSPYPYCTQCNGEGKYNFSLGGKICSQNCFCIEDNYFHSETPQKAIQRIWEAAFDRVNENVYPKCYKDPLMNFVQSLSYGDWLHEKSQKWADEFCEIAAYRIRNHFNGGK